MAKKRPRPEDIITNFMYVEVLMRQGTARLDAIKQIGVIEQTCYRWRKQYGGMDVRLKAREINITRDQRPMIH